MRQQQDADSERQKSTRAAPGDHFETGNSGIFSLGYQ